MHHRNCCHRYQWSSWQCHDHQPHLRWVFQHDALMYPYLDRKSKLTVVALELMHPDIPSCRCQQTTDDHIYQHAIDTRIRCDCDRVGFVAVETICIANIFIPMLCLLFRNFVIFYLHAIDWCENLDKPEDLGSIHASRLLQWMQLWLAYPDVGAAMWWTVDPCGASFPWESY